MVPGYSRFLQERLMDSIQQKKDELSPSSTIVVYSAPLVRALAAHRCPPTWLGLVRRVRPSTGAIQRALSEPDGASDPNPACRSTVVYKIVDENGTERRMTSAEKKQARLQAAQLKKEQKKQEKHKSNESHLMKDLADHERYFQLDIDRKLMADELAEMKGLRDGVPPVALGPALARQATVRGLLPGLAVAPLRVIFDEELSSEWARRIKSSMARAEKHRAAEDLRAMPYQLNPEAWSRMRPQFTETEILSDLDTWDPRDGKGTWSEVKMQSPSTSAIYNTTANAIVQLLYQANTLEVSCGAKFGSDYLLYQGSRVDSHAFAGLRIECSEALEKLALPSAYDLSGFVRGLNTAAKLALLATVLVDGDVHRVAVVDLALEKVLPVGKNKRAGPSLSKLSKRR